MEFLLKVLLATGLLLAVASPAASATASAKYGPDKHTRFELVNEYGVPQPVEISAYAENLEPWRTNSYNSEEGESGVDTYFPIGSNGIVTDGLNNQWNFSVTEDSPEVVVLTRDAFYKRTPVKINNYATRAIGIVNDIREDRGLERLQISNALSRYIQTYSDWRSFGENEPALCYDLGVYDCGAYAGQTGLIGDKEFFDNGVEEYVVEYIPNLFDPKLDAVGANVTRSKGEFTYTFAAMNCSAIPDMSACELTGKTGNSRANIDNIPDIGGPGVFEPKKNPKLRIKSKKLKKLAPNRVGIKVVASVDLAARGTLFMTVSMKSGKKRVRFTQKGKRFVFRTTVRTSKRPIRVRVIFKGGQGWQNATRRFEIRK